MQLLAVVLGVLGAWVVALILFVVLVPRTPDDWASGWVLVLLAGPTAIIGGIAGSMMYSALSAGQPQRGALVAAAAMVLIGGMVYKAAHPKAYVFVPADARSRTRWAKRVKVQEMLGEYMAKALEQYVRSEFAGQATDVVLRRDQELRRSRADLDADSLAQLGAYTTMDHGWRWKALRETYPPRLVVLPDPLLRKDGPIFEVEPFRILRRQAPGEPESKVVPTV